MTKLLVVDSHPIVRIGLDTCFKNSDDIEVVGSLNNSVDIFDFIENNHVDIVMLEINFFELNGFTALKAIKKQNPELNVLFFTDANEDIYALSSIRSGASGFVSKSVSSDELIEAIHKVSRGEIALNEKMTRQYNRLADRKNKSEFKKLSSREVQVLGLIAKGRKNKEIAEELDINEKTVSTYKLRLLNKLHVDNIIDLLEQVKHQQIY